MMSFRRSSAAAPVALALGAAACAVAAACVPGAPSSPGATAGTVLVRTFTTGPVPPASYEVLVDGRAVGSVAADGEVEVPGISPGRHDVELHTPVNCTVDGTNPREITVSEGLTSEVAFDVVCTSPPTGTLELTTSTSGDDLDEDGYSVAVDGTDRGPVGIDETVTFEVRTGDREVELRGIADNCEVQGANPRVLPVNDGQTTPTTFAVVCAETDGSIDVSVSTSGFNQDDSYTVDLDGSRAETLESDDSVVFEDVPAGRHTVTLGDVAPNCEVEGDNPVTVDVVADETSEVDFEVDCSFF